MNFLGIQTMEGGRCTIVEGSNLSTLLVLVQQIAGHGAADGDVDSGLETPDLFIHNSSLGENAVLSQALSDDGGTIVVPVNDQMALLEPVDELHHMEGRKRGRVLIIAETIHVNKLSIDWHDSSRAERERKNLLPPVSNETRLSPANPSFCVSRPSIFPMPIHPRCAPVAFFSVFSFDSLYSPGQHRPRGQPL